MHMKTAIILHGMPSKEGYYNPDRESQSNEHWLPWLQRQLLLKDILAQAIELPKPYEPDYQSWSRVFEQFNIDEHTILVGHSCGAGFLVRWLSENKVNVDKVALVAPWINPDPEAEPHIQDTSFFEFEIDEGLLSRTKGIIIFNSTDDYKDVNLSVKIIRNAVRGIEYHEFNDRGHFTLGDTKTREFPELLEAILSSSKGDE